MQRYVFQRILGIVPILFVVSILAFSLLHLIPGDPVRTLLGMTATPEQIEAARVSLGLTDPLPVQYLHFLGNALQGDLGRSILSRKPVSYEIASRLGATFELALAATAMTTLLGIILGILSAVYRGSWIDVTAMLLSTLGISIPVYWLGLMLMLLFAVQLHWFPTAGRAGPEYLVLPTLTLGIYSAAFVTRMTRSSMLEALSQDFARTARAKGLHEQAVIGRHVLRNALIPIITVIGLQLSVLLSGAVITETVFAWPGIGKLAVDAIRGRDYPLVQGLILFMATAVVVVNLLVDILYAVVDPRIRYG